MPERLSVIGMRHLGLDTQLFDVLYGHYLSFITSLAEKDPDVNTQGRVAIYICLTVINPIFLI